MNRSYKDKGFALRWISEYRKELFGIAILSIMFFHFTIIHLDYYENGQSLLHLLVSRVNKYIGSAGVDVFVFLSGVGLYYSFSKNSDIPGFYNRRYKRILPPYVIVGSVFWLFIDIIYLDRGFTRWLEDFFFITFFREGVNNFWFIAFIGIMYLIFPVLYKALFENKIGLVLFLLITAVSLTAPVWIYNHQPDIYSRLNIALTRIPMFILGTYAGKYIKEDRHTPHLAAIGLILFGFICKYYAVSANIKGSFSRYASGLLALSTILLFTYVFRLLHEAKIIRRAVCYFGEYSLEFYLLHVALWGILAGAGVPLYRSSRYLMMIYIAMILAPLLSKVTTTITNRNHS